jgi:hypothetical protein
LGDEKILVGEFLESGTQVMTDPDIIYISRQIRNTQLAINQAPRGREYRSIEPFGFEETEEKLVVAEGGGDV